MRLCWIPRLVPILLVGLVLGGCEEKWSWNQKITVTVATPEGDKSASSTIRHRLDYTKGGWLTTPGARSRYSGEAVVLEIGNGRYLFALLGDAPDVFQVFFPGEAPVEVAGRFKTLRETRTVPPKQYPLLVTFGDLADPASVKLVDPDDPDAALGCAANAVEGMEPPWRKAELTHAQWVKDETWRLANERASAQAGISGEAAAALEAYFRIARPSYGPNAAEKQRLAELRREFTKDQMARWVDARKHLVTTIPATLPSPENYVAAAGGKTCYRIKSITLEITDEPVTGGRVESLLVWLKWSRENFLASGDGRSPLQLPYKDGFFTLGHTDFRRK